MCYVPYTQTVLTLCEYPDFKYFAVGSLSSDTTGAVDDDFSYF